MEDCRVVELRHRSEPAEFPGELHECDRCLGWIILSRFTRGSRNEETRIVTNRVFNEEQTEVTQEHGEEHPNSFDT